MEGRSESDKLTLVARKPCFGLPTACPFCLPVFIHLKFSQIPFLLDINLSMPDSDQIPYVERGAYVAYNNEKGGVIERLREDGIADLDSRIGSIPDFISMKAMVSTWLKDAVEYEIWLGNNGTSAYKVYYSDLPWPIGKLLQLKQMHTLRRWFGITKDNAEQKEEEIYRRAHMAYEALSTRLGEDNFFFEDRPTSLDAVFLGHALFTLQALPESSPLRREFLEYRNLVRYAEKHKTTCIDASSSSHVEMPTSSSSNPKQGAKPKRKQKREMTEEEKTFRKRAKYFLVAQFIAVLSFLTIMNRSDDAEVDIDFEDEDGVDYD